MGWGCGFGSIRGEDEVGDRSVASVYRSLLTMLGIRCIGECFGKRPSLRRDAPIIELVKGVS